MKWFLNNIANIDIYMKWNKQTKEAISYIVSCLSFIFGIVLTIMGFLVHPLGEIHDSVLWVLAQTLTYSGAIFGVGLYIKGKSEEIKEYINNKNTSNNLDNSD